YFLLSHHYFLIWKDQSRVLNSTSRGARNQSSLFQLLFWGSFPRSVDFLLSHHHFCHRRGVLCRAPTITSVSDLTLSPCLLSHSAGNLANGNAQFDWKVTYL